MKNWYIKYFNLHPRGVDMKKKIVKFLIEFVGDLSFVVTLIIGSIFFAAVMIGIGLGMYQLAAWLVSLF